MLHKTVVSIKLVLLMAETTNKQRDGQRAVHIGAAIGPHDPFWVQVRETVFKRIEQLGGILVPLEISESNENLFSLDPASLAEEVLAQDLDAVVCQTLPVDTIQQLVNTGVPVVFLGESEVRHPLFCSPIGLYEAGRIAARYITDRLGGRGRALCAGGLLDLGDDKGVTRMKGFFDHMAGFPEMTVLHCPTAWRYDQAYLPVKALLSGLDRPVDAIYGLSDSIALAARDAAQALGIITPETIIVGINGDPLALAGIMEGTFSATVDTSSEELGKCAVDLIFKTARGACLPQHYDYVMTLVTPENVHDFAARKLAAIAQLPSRLVGVNREEERYRLMQMETGSVINRHVGSLLNRHELTSAIADLLRVSYGFDRVQFIRWLSGERRLVVDQVDPDAVQEALSFEAAGLLGVALQRCETIYIPDTRHSSRYPLDPTCPDTRARVVLPVRLGDEILGLLDMHSHRPMYNLRWDLISLQALADQFAIALRNADLYNQALKAGEAAERASQLKTRLLANVSHELRTPLNVILGYSQAAMSTPNPYGVPLPEGLLHDLGYIFQSGEHLIRVINDLLDLSRAEIGELNVFPEPVDTRPFLASVFDSISNMNRDERSQVTWVLQLPRRLPAIQADPVRLRQILFNLFSNAVKFTTSGQITLGAEVEPPYLHVWVADTGAGIPAEQQEQIFEPFVTTESPARRREGIGLGLSITRRLVSLHGGMMSVESQAGKGSTFHIYWPLPSLSGAPVLPREPVERAALVLLSARSFTSQKDLPAEILTVAERQNLEICQVHSINLLNELVREVNPVALAWDMSGALPGEWNVIQFLCSHPRFSGLPLILLGSESPCSTPVGTTNLLIKPFSGQTLAGLIESMRPTNDQGTVLIVDDDPQALEMYRVLVEKALPGCLVWTAADGQQALDKLREHTPALVVLDLLMPKVNGFEVLERMRSDSRTCRIPVIVLSGKMLTFEDVSRLNYANVVFYSKGVLNTEEIVQALQQTVAEGVRLGQPTSRLVKQALAYLHQNYSRTITRSELAEMVGVSDNYLTQIFHQELGLSPLECLNRLRILKARELLIAGDDSVSLIAARVGFDDPAYFSRVFRKLTGKSPNAYRREH